MGTEVHPRDQTLSEQGSAAHAHLSELLVELARAPQVEGGEPIRSISAGTVVGRFELRRELGSGGFGVVYEAWDRDLHRAVAFKLVRPGRVAAEDQLRREAEIIAQLSHPNLVTLFDVGRSAYGPYLVLELLHGETLQQRLKRGTVNVRDAVRIALAVARGLGHAHAHGVVHRDLKPSNVFVCDEGEAKLLDFGMSHAFGRREVAGGTLAYMAPEQRRGAPEDERTDVFALGVILFEMLSGRHPVLGAETPGKGRALDGLDPALAAIVRRMLQVDPTERPRSGSEVAAALAEVLQSLGDDKPAPRPLLRFRLPRRAWWMAAALTLAVLMALLVRWALDKFNTTPAPRSIAVLAFKNLSGSPENEYLSDGLTEEILHRLARVGGLKVVRSASSLPFKNQSLSDKEIARRLGVDLVLRGSVRREGERLRVGAELIEPRAGLHLWSQMYDRRLADIFAIQEEIARQVVDALELVISRTSDDGFDKFQPANLEAYDAYLRARAALRMPVNDENIRAAIGLFEQALAADGTFGRAYTGLCDAWIADYGLRRAPQSYEKAQAACQRALQYEPQDAHGYVSLGNLRLLSGDAVGAEQEFRRATIVGRNPADAFLGLASAFDAQQRFDEAARTFELATRMDPGYWQAYQAYGIYLFKRGRYAEAARQFGEAIARSPDNASAYNNLGAIHLMAGEMEAAAEAWRKSITITPSLAAYSNIGSSLFYLRRFDEAAEMYQKAIEFAPEDHRLWANLADAYAMSPERTGQSVEAYRKAIALAEKRLAINPTDGQTTASLAAYFAKLGDAERARRLIAKALKLEPKNIYAHYYAALAAMRLADHEGALDALEGAVSNGYPRHLVGADAQFDPIRGHARFAAITAEPK